MKNEISTAKKLLNVVSDIQEVIDKSNIDSDELYYVMRCIKALNVYESEESREIWMAEQGADKALQKLQRMRDKQ